MNGRLIAAPAARMPTAHHGLLATLASADLQCAERVPAALDVGHLDAHSIKAVFVKTSRRGSKVGGIGRAPGSRGRRARVTRSNT